jgi:hypothetical protein
MPTFAVLLPIGAIGFYLFDAALMLYGNEFVLLRSRAHWYSAGGQVQLLGRRLYVPNPFTPGRMLFRLRWDQARSAEGALDIDGLVRLTRPLRVIVTLQTLILLWLLPPVSIALGAGNFLLVLFAAYYLLTLLSTAMLTRRRKALGLTDRHCAFLALEAMLCAPFALNMVRKVALARSAEVAWLETAESAFAGNEKRQIAECVGVRIEEGLAIEEPGSVRAAQLRTLRDGLKERLHVPVPG